MEYVLLFLSLDMAHEHSSTKKAIYPFLLKMKKINYWIITKFYTYLSL